MTFCAYNNNVPAAADAPADDQPEMLINTASISLWASQDHIGFNMTNGGIHDQVRMPPQSGPPALAGTGMVWTQSTTDGNTNLFYTNGVTGNLYQLTRVNQTNFPTFSTNTAYGSPPAGFTQTGGWTFLPGGMLMQYGFFGKTGGLGTSGTIQFPFTFTNIPYSVTATISRASAGGGAGIVVEVTGTVTTSSFGFASSTSSSDGVYWMAIGV
jgi:hypothetical protein